jgi:hypothetical protein
MSTWQPRDWPPEPGHRPRIEVLPPQPAVVRITVRQRRHAFFLAGTVQMTQSGVVLQKDGFSVDKFLKHPVTALVASLIFGAVAFLALSGRYVIAGYVLLGVTWVVIVWVSRRLPFAYCTGSSIAAAVALVLFGYYFTPEPTPTNFGELRPRILLSGDQIVPRIEIGGTGTSITQTDPKDYGAYIFPFLKREQFKIEIVDRIAKFSTKITDENDHLIAEIVRNEWLVAPPPQSWDRNYNDDSLEVKDARGDIVLQVKVLSDRIQFQGVWWADRSSILAERSRVEIFENKAAHPWSAQIYIVPNNGSPKPIEPIFLYPSGRHLSELSKPQKSN